MISVFDEGVKHHFIKLLAAPQEINCSFLIVLFQINKMKNINIFIVSNIFSLHAAHDDDRKVLKKGNAGQALKFLRFSVLARSSFRAKCVHSSFIFLIIILEREKNVSKHIVNVL